ncbi:hypothetical protein M9H77_18009 [Catharanthus roseus]|uniref:Uncharacterized protein n=1 Tax=Catharanthus roseus TaxID=4058 RepID=A0ACC0B6A2_CATRO|nr:hypothetical protein M9H77_18009 [Catharanthus roseus]
MISTRKLIRMARKWQKKANIGRKRISFQRNNENTTTSDCSSSSSPLARKGHFVVYSADQKRYNMPLLEAVGMTLTSKNFTVATAFMHNEQVWISEVLHFGVETTNRAESEHSVLKLWLSMCHGDLEIVFLNIDSVIESQISNNISHLVIKKIWLEIKRACEIVDDPQNKCGQYLRKSHGLPCACELVGRDKSYWEHVSIAHRKIGKSSGSGSGSGLGSGSRTGSSSRGRAPSTFLYIDAFPGFAYEFIHNWKNVMGDSNCGFRVVANFLFRDKNQWPEICRQMTFELQLHTNMYASLFGSVERAYELIQRTQWFERHAPLEHWLDTPDHLYVFANTFNFCVVLVAGLGSTTLLPLYSSFTSIAGILCIGYLSEQQYFTQVS